MRHQQPDENDTEWETGMNDFRSISISNKNFRSPRSFKTTKTVLLFYDVPVNKTKFCGHSKQKEIEMTAGELEVALAKIDINRHEAMDMLGSLGKLVYLH